MSLPQTDTPAQQVVDAPLSPVAAVDATAETSTLSRRRKGLRGLGLIICLSWLTLVVVCAVLASWLPIQDPSAIDPINRLQSPSPDHFFGTDQLGRDVLSRVIFGSRVSAVVAVVALLIGVLFGGTIGIVAGFLRGRVEALIMWCIDVLLSFPALVLLIALVAYLGRSLTNISLAVGFLAIPVYARIARANTLSVGRAEFVLAARAAGSGKVRTLWREITPNVLPSILAYGFIAMSLTIVVEGTLSFLGLSVSAPTSSWGGLIADGQHHMGASPHLVIIPAGILCATVLALNLAGETFRQRYESHGS